MDDTKKTLKRLRGRLGNVHFGSGEVLIVPYYFRPP